MPQYRRPPITEAVIEFRFEQPLDAATVDKLNAKFRESYPFSYRVATLGFNLNLEQSQAIVNQQNTGYRLVSADQTEIVIIGPNGFACSRLAPYNGWDAFRTQVEQNQREWKEVVGYRKLTRIGARYINRIDVPATPNSSFKLEDYIKVFLVIPDGTLAVISSYASQMGGALGSDNCNLIINSSLVPSPLVDHMSFLLDLDLSRETELPQKDADIWDFLEWVRGHKNRLFESFITDRARELFR